MQWETADFTPGAATWQTRRNMRRFWFCTLVLLCENMSSSTKPEVHNVSHCRLRRTGEPRPQVRCIENLVKSLHERRDEQTYIYAVYNTSHGRTPNGGEVITAVYVQFLYNAGGPTCIHMLCSNVCYSSLSNSFCLSHTFYNFHSIFITFVYFAINFLLQPYH